MRDWNVGALGLAGVSPSAPFLDQSIKPAGTNATVIWQSVAGVSYFLEASTNLSASPPFTLVATNLLGQPGTTSYTDTNAARASPYLRRRNRA
jgi:hypothetical protein